MTQSKKTNRVFLAIAYIALLAVILFSISRLIGYLNKGAERATILHLPKFEPEHHAQYSLVDDGNDGSIISSETLDQLIKDYLLAWKSKQRGISYQQPEYFSDHFTPKIQKRFQNLITNQQAKNIREESIDLNHHIDIKFHNLDKSLVVLEDTDVVQHRRIFQDGVLINTETDTSAYQVICLREDGHWRIRHLTSIENSNTQVKQSIDEITNQISLNEVAGWQGLNYYPRDYAWDAFNLNIEEKTSTDDLALIKSLGLNTIRVFIQYDDFGGPIVRQDKLDQLKKFLDFAIQYDIGVILTLFDFYGDYSLEDWTKTDHHLISIVNAIKNHPALLAYDIKNEPDLDFESRGKDLVLEWLSHQVDVINTLDKSHPITIGWSNAEVAIHLADTVDFVSFHYYLTSDKFKSTTDQLLETLGPDKPIFLSEFGKTSYRGLWNPIQFSKKKQANYISNVIQQSAASQIGYLTWTLYDFPTIPSQVVGRLPWRKKYQQHYGILESNGSQKPAFSSLKNR